jgi:predicted RNA-binding protein with PIN domain
MPLIIDGNNLLHASMPPSLAGLEERGLCRLLARSPWQGQRMVVVLDGAPSALGQIESPEPAVELIWSGPRRSADDVIIDLVQRDSAPRRIVVVSSDHALQRQVKRRRVRVLEAAEFVSVLAGLLGEATGSAGPARPQNLSDDEVDRWLREFGIDDP